MSTGSVFYWMKLVNRRAFHLTGILGAWQHTLAKSATTRVSLKSFLLKELITDGNGSIRAPTSSFSFPLSSLFANRSPRKLARSRANASHRIEGLRENHFRFRPADLPRRQEHCFCRFPPESRPGPHRSRTRLDRYRHGSATCPDLRTQGRRLAALVTQRRPLGICRCGGNRKRRQAASFRSHDDRRGSPEDYRGTQRH